MSTKVQLIGLTPPESIVFSMLEKEPSVTLMVQNTSDKVVAFKVKTTHPKRYLVRPNQDVIPVGGISSVKISLQIKDAKQLRQERITGLHTLEEDCTDNKFLVQSTVVKEHATEEFLGLHESASAKELGAKLKDMWADTTKDEFVNKKLTCAFDYPNDAKELMEVNNLHKLSSIPYAFEISGSSDAAAKAGGSPPLGASVLEGSAAASAAATAAAGGASPSSAGATRTVDIQELVELRNKYNELVNFTVQLTSQRDQYKASCKEATKEVAMLKKGAAGASSAASAAHAASAASAASGGAATAPSTLTTPFSLWQIMLVAVIAFLMGRLIV